LRLEIAMAIAKGPVPPSDDHGMGLGAGSSDGREITSEPSPQEAHVFDFDSARATDRVGASTTAGRAFPLTRTVGALALIAGLLVLPGFFKFAVTLLFIVLFFGWLAFGWILCASCLGEAFRKEGFVKEPVKESFFMKGSLIAILSLVYPGLLALLYWWIGGPPKDIESVRLFIVIHGGPWVVLFPFSIYSFCKPFFWSQW